MKKMFAVLLVLAVLPVGAFACTAIYAGSALTEDGSTVFARLEEYYSDGGWPKFFDVVPEGAYRSGEVYTGCYGFIPMTAMDIRRSAITFHREPARIAGERTPIRLIRLPEQTAGG